MLNPTPYSIMPFHASISLSYLVIPSCALLLFNMPAHAYTTSTCEEAWYEPENSVRVSETHNPWKQVKQASCKKHHEKVIGIAQLPTDNYTDVSRADESSAFAMIDGNGYHVKTEVVHQGPYCSHGDTPGIDPQCILPQSLRHYEVHRRYEYYLVSTGRELHRVKACGPAYATDGDSVFFSRRDYSYRDGSIPEHPFKIVGADSRSFECFLPEGDSGGNVWSRDALHVFYYGRLANGMSPAYPVRFFDDKLLNVSALAANNGKVFIVDITDGIKLLPGVNADLKILSQAFFSDGMHIYDRNFVRMEGVRPDVFTVVTPTCPVAGNPDLPCAAVTTQNVAGGFGIQDGMLIIPGPDRTHAVSIPGLRAKSAAIFLLDGIFHSVSGTSPFMLFEGRLYNIDELADGKLRGGLPLRGRLRRIPDGTHCTLNDAHDVGLDQRVMDDMGSIDLDSLTRIGTCKH